MRLLEVGLKDKSDFLKVTETLRRIGVADSQKKEIRQSVFILHKTGRYYLMHVNELHVLDGMLSEVPETAIATRNTVASLLENWGLVKIVIPAWAEAPRASMKEIMVVSHKKKSEWTFIPMYEIGKKREKS